ncbi:ribonuclease Y [Desulfobulbus oligotrophicus]|uniref:Ribonuclease Y n=1 Tax=Desulfobulbus oligotrophicus TaxID=1909699 RepID=A0A7T5VFH3_9BACT|nr:ribonuclease Y [Desulfobulbus oligotrophicus]MDY0391515.1 ribonuclease Y [Desulfobulbus oligotrophicus]QQG66975.1 ribonuclease Y [Desulfobulbus oligotrophicus]
MDLNIIILLFTLTSLVAGLVIGILLRKKLVEGNQKNIALQGRQIIENSINEAEQIKKEAILQAKEEAFFIKQEADKELKANRLEIKEDQRRLDRKFDEVQKEFQILEERQTYLKYREEELIDQEAEIVGHRQKLDGLIEEQRYKLEQIAGIGQEEAKVQLMQLIESEVRMDCAKRLVRIENEMKIEADRKGKNILALAIARYAGDYVADKTVSVVSLPNEEMKGRIIGREGRNIRAIEAATGVDIIIDDTPEAVILSGFNPIRREVARLALEQLISDGRIHPARIEEVVQKVSEELEVGIRESGEQATFDVGAHGMHVELINLIGRLKYRTSYGQNILQHSLEVAFLCGVMAAELGLDVKKAKRAGLLHDIGKAVDHEVEGSHAIIGRDLARKYGEAEDVVYAIGAHHEDQPPKSVLDVLVQSADALSGARPGARKEMLQSYVKRLEDLEKIASGFTGVEKSYAIQAGRDLRIIVDSQKIRDEETVLLSRDIAKAIEEQLTYPGQIRVTVIRETRAVEYAK